MTDDMADVLRVISDGRWRTIDGVAASLGWQRRAVEEAIQQLRLAHYPILGGSQGVRLTDDYREVRAQAQDLRARIVTQARTARAMLTTARRMEAREQGYDPDRPRLWDAA